MLSGIRLRSLLVAIALIVGSLPPVAAPARPVLASQPGTDRPLPRLLSYVPLGSELVAYSNLIDLKRLIGAEVSSHEDVPLPPDGVGIRPAAGEAVSPAEQVGRAWWWDVGSQIPISPFMNVISSPPYIEEDWLGVNLFKVRREITVGKPAQELGVIEGAIDAGVTGQKLTALGYSSEASALGTQARLYSRLDDFQVEFKEKFSAATLGRFNRVVLTPELMIAGSATEVVGRSVEAATGHRPSLASDPDFRLLATTMDDPDLLPGTTLLGAMLFGGTELAQTAEAGMGSMECLSTTPMEQVRERERRQLETEPLLPPYRLSGFGFRRGGDISERYWLFTLVYDDEPTAAAAATTVMDRISRYRVAAFGRRPERRLFGEYIREILPAVIRPADGRVTLSLLARITEEREASLLRLYVSRELGFLAWGKLIRLC